MTAVSAAAAGRGGERALTRELFRSAPKRTLKAGSGWKPDVLLVEVSGTHIVVKDFAERARWVRRWLAGWLVRRELHIYRVLEDVPQVPRAVCQIDALAFAIEHRPGDPLERALAPRVPPAFQGELESAVRALHERGVVHLDLSHRGNVLLDPDGHPVLLDFAGSMCFRPGSPLYRWYRPSVLRYDRRALAKWRERLRDGAEGSPRTWRRRLRSWIRRRRSRGRPMAG